MQSRPNNKDNARMTCSLAVPTRRRAAPCVTKRACTKPRNTKLRDNHGCLSTCVHTDILLVGHGRNVRGCRAIRPAIALPIYAHARPGAIQKRTRTACCCMSHTACCHAASHIYKYALQSLNLVLIVFGMNWTKHPGLQSSALCKVIPKYTTHTKKC